VAVFDDGNDDRRRSYSCACHSLGSMACAKETHSLRHIPEPNGDCGVCELVH
jgi:hypothetical protein